MSLQNKTNNHLKDLVGELKKQSNEQKVNLWKRIASDLERPTRKRRAVNLYKICRNIKDDETAIVPGKVLAVGEINKKVTVAAFQFSQQARDKINNQGKAISIAELMKINPKGQKVRIIG